MWVYKLSFGYNSGGILTYPFSSIFVPLWLEGSKVFQLGLALGIICGVGSLTVCTFWSVIFVLPCSILGEVVFDELDAFCFHVARSLGNDNTGWRCFCGDNLSISAWCDRVLLLMIYIDLGCLISGFRWGRTHRLTILGVPWWKFDVQDNM